MEKSILKRKDEIVLDVAIIEVKNFVEKWSFEEKEDYQIKDDYPQLLTAVCKGLLIFDKDNKPVYKLAYPVKTDSGSIAVEEVKFRTRIKPTDLANITKGLNVVKQQMDYTLRCLCYITGESATMLDKFHKFDYKVIEQVSTVFF